MKRKLLGIILILLLSVNCLIFQSAAEVGTAQYILNDKTVQVGDTFQIDVAIAENPGIITLRFKIIYDTDVLKLESVTDSGLLNEYTTPAPTITSPYTLRWADSRSTVDNTAQGTVATLTFTALKAADSSVITIEHVEARNAIGTKVDFNSTVAEVKIEAIPVPVTGISLNKNSLSLSSGASETLIATVSPETATDKGVTWRSDDPTVATVDENGKVTGVKTGSTTITVTTNDGGFSTSCSVSVYCAHNNKISVSEQNSDCKTQGWDAYMKCSDCGQLFDANGTTEISEIPYRALAKHTGGTATCVDYAVCTVCGDPYGDLADHNYTSEEKKQEALKFEGSCCEESQYWYSCSVCGDVEKDDDHIFNGEKNADKHSGGTTVINKTDADHKTLTNGYTGDTQCLGCQEIIATGETIYADRHIASDDWSSDGEYHWKECKFDDCDEVIDGTKEAHSSTGTNAATCQNKAVCDVCGTSYGDYADHNWDTDSWQSDENGHWYGCLTEGCTEQNSFAAHTPDHEGGATEEYAVKCSVCGYVIEEQLGHEHVFDKEIADKKYEASKATCIAAATYYKSCACGEKGTETFTYGEPGGHTECREYDCDENYHWRECVDCGEVVDESRMSHIADHIGGATEEYAVKCLICGYVIEAQLGHEHVFSNKVVDDKYEASKATCTASAKYYKSCECGEKGTETFSVGDALGHTDDGSWEYDKNNHWRECADCGAVIANSKAGHTPDHDGGATEEYAVKCSVCGYVIEEQLGHVHVYDKEIIDSKYEAGKADCTTAATYYKSCECGKKGDEIFIVGEALSHTDADNDGTCDECGYVIFVETEEPDDTTDEVQSPQSDDNWTTWLWSALLLVSGLGIVTATVIKKKHLG